VAHYCEKRAVHAGSAGHCKQKINYNGQVNSFQFLNHFSNILLFFLSSFSSFLLKLSEEFFCWCHQHFQGNWYVWLLFPLYFFKCWFFHRQELTYKLFFLFHICFYSPLLSIKNIWLIAGKLWTWFPNKRYVWMSTFASFLPSFFPWKTSFNSLKNSLFLPILLRIDYRHTKKAIQVDCSIGTAFLHLKK